MGTRNLTCVVLDGQIKVAQYGQWDGYPNGQGETIAQFIRTKMVLPTFIAAVKNCKWATDEYVDSICKNKDWETTNPEFSRNTAADILEIIQNRGGLQLTDHSEFAADSLFCEWAYVVDLDKMNLEVYQGFNKNPVPAGERFAHLPIKEVKTPYTNPTDERQYYQVKLWRTIPFTELQADTMDILEKQLEKENKE